MPTDTVTYLTPPEAAKIVRVSEEKIVVWIRAGELRAANVSEGRVPRFRIHRDDLQSFLRSREPVPPEDAGRRQEGQRR
jgi:excisionase family DNA binding protein